MILTEIATAHGFAAGDIDTAGYVAVIPAYQKCYFADGRTNGFHKLDMINSIAVGEVTGTFTKGEVLTQATSLAEGIFDENFGSGATAHSCIYRTTPTAFVTGQLITGATSGATVTPTAIKEPPYWRVWTPSQGALPDGGSNIGCLYSGRIMLNSVQSPHQWYASRQGDPLDWLFVQNDVGSPISSQNSKAGLVGDPLVAFVPYQDHYCIFGCASELWVMRGDPGAGGILTDIDRKTGMFGPQSWCWDEKGNLFFAGLDGIYILPSGAAVNGGKPTNLTSQRAPKLMQSLGLNRKTDRVVLAHDKARHGIIMSVVMMDGSWSSSFWFDLRTEGLFPERYASNAVPASALYFDSYNQNLRGLLLGGQDGYIRKFDETAKDDDNGAATAAIDSYLTLGPITLAGHVRGEGIISEMEVRLSDDTDGVDYEVHTGNAAEKVVNNIKDGVSTHASGTLTGGGRKSANRPRARGAVGVVKVGNSTAGESFALESVKITKMQAGKVKGV